jgi:2-polyprenyl-3-methyl-5-hydroxy-6-metoxy-1,4-benzoquinol methylase
MQPTGPHLSPRGERIAAESAAPAGPPAQAREPRLLVAMLGDAGDPERACAALRRLGELPRAARVAVLLESEGPRELDSGPWREAAARLPGLKVHVDARRHGHGGRRKLAYEYALQHGFDHVVVLEPDGRHPPESVGELWRAALAGAELVIGSRAVPRPLAHELLLGLGLRDYSSPLRMVSTRVLARVPFHLDGDGREFDTELLIQARALGVTPREVDLALEHDASFSAGRSLRVALGYRAHQLHLTRDGRYFVDHDVRYTLKHHPSSSHSQVLDAIRPGSLVLDLGCSQGLLAAPLAAKRVRVVGVDVGDPRRVSAELERYHRRDLELPLEIPEGRVFDYVVCSDVIEHVVRRAELLRSVRRYLRPDGRLLISTPNIAIWFYRLSLAAGRFEYGPRGVLDETHVHLYTRSTFRREVEGAGFRVLRERVTALPFEVVFESTGRSALVRGVTGAYHALARAWPEMFAYQFLLEAEATTLLDPGHEPLSDAPAEPSGAGRAAPG